MPADPKMPFFWHFHGALRAPRDVQVKSKVVSFLGDVLNLKPCARQCPRNLHDLYIVCDLFLNIVSPRPLQTMPGQALSGNFRLLS